MISGQQSRHLQAILRTLGIATASPWGDDKPIREELFSAERLEEHARSLAGAQPVATKRMRSQPLSSRLDENESALRRAFRGTVGAVEAGIAITPAAEWLSDNYHIVESQIREVRADLPPGYYRQLPKLVSGPFAGHPRVLGLAWAYVAHTDSNFDAELLRRYVRAYQEVQPLTIGELWAVAITLRFVLIENLCRLAVRIERSLDARLRADALAERLLGVGDKAPEAVQKVLDDAPDGPIPDAFAVEFVHMLRDQHSGVVPALAWLDDRLSERGTTTDMAIAYEQERQVRATVTVRNIITSMRLISEIDWMTLFERISLVDDVLAGNGVYSGMDFASRNLYRNAIEELARSSPLSETEIAQLAVDASQNSKVSGDPRRSDVGYHLLSSGRADLEDRIRYRMPIRALPQRITTALGIGGYAAGIVCVGALILIVPLLALSATGLGTGWLVALGMLGAIPALDAAVGLVNVSVTRAITSTPLPALELKGGVPTTLRTIVAVPTLLTSRANVERQIEELEVHHLASLEGDVHFALLSDWADAAEQQVKGDDELLAAAQAGIARLNAIYSKAPGGDRFLLLHRRRVWNESERRWIGWERKRGKLHELNRLLRGAKDTNFITSDGQPPYVPADVRFVITLDADTKLPRDTVRRLIGKLAHPLNRPRFDSRSGRVVEGHGVLQPRITISLPLDREGSLFHRIFANASGIDPYAAAASDVYQDLFGEGSYAGKGIYDVDSFEAALAGRVPESTLLSHDLFEGIFARAGLASDVEVIEDFPARHDVSVRRNHRWARGDWQLLPWVFGISEKGKSLPIVGRAKMVDNLRRSLTAPSCVLGLITGWALNRDVALIWSSFLVVALAAPALIPFFDGLLSRAPGNTLKSRLQALATDLKMALARWILLLAFLAEQAWSMGDAIIRTLVRIVVTRRHLLQWVTAAQLESGPEPTLSDYYRNMASALAIAVAAVSVASYWGEGTWPFALAFGLLWTASPAIAWQISAAPPAPRRLQITPSETRSLRQIARRTWRFFEATVTPADHMLPPDNFQETPNPVLAHRTSPTNIGMYLLSVASARDFGWIGTWDALIRIEETLTTLTRMARFRGHFYNWYDTRDLRALDPHYVSTVDSGNLAGHLIVLANACAQWEGIPAGRATDVAGAADSLDLAQAAIQALEHKGISVPAGWQAIDAAVTSFSERLDRIVAGDIIVSGTQLLDLSKAASAIAHDATGTSIHAADPLTGDVEFWLEATRSTIESHQRDLDRAPDSEALRARLEAAAQSCREIVLEMEFAFLLDEDRKLLSIGYLPSEGTHDLNCYDLLASEARLASFLAIAKGDLPARHWFLLGHAVAPVPGGSVLISWSGSMFEYLMPTLVMRSPGGSLLESTERRIVTRQIEYGRQRDVPWGISESAFNARDLEFTYQYSNFGVPGLGLKRGLAENLVIAPYATALAAMIEPQAALRNFQRIEAAGGLGVYGFYEALDYTPSRVPANQKVAVVRTYMAHHQGMTIVALANTLLDGVMRDRFHAEPIVKSAELLLQERIPRQVPVAFQAAADESKAAKLVNEFAPPAGRRFASVGGAAPATHLLSNGRYTVMLTAAGSGQSRWRDLAVTRWREDATCDDWGSYIFLRDVASNEVWSAAYQPTGKDPDRYGVVFHEDRAEYTRSDGDLVTSMTVLVSAEDDSEVRRITLTNTGRTVREIEITSFAELALAPQAADVAHPSFSKLFVQTERLPGSGALLAHRRRREPHEEELWAAHLAAIEGEAIGSLEFETDRAQFLGRGSSSRAPRAIVEGRSLSGTTGTVLDPMFAIRTRVSLAPGASTHISFWTMVGSSREEVLDLVDKNRMVARYERAAALAWTQAQVQLHHLRLSPADAGEYQRLAGHILYASPALRMPSEVIEQGAGSQPGLWSLGISGDLPIIVLRVTDVEHLGIARDLLQATDYWRMKRLSFDVVILNERGASYIQDLQNELETLVRTSHARAQFGERSPGGIFVLRADLVPQQARDLLLSTARAVLRGRYGRLASQLDATLVADPQGAWMRKPVASTGQAPVPTRIPELEYFNGLGGFARDGREYVIALGPGQQTPSPWINVVANPHFGFQVSAEGAGYTWASNSREHQITPWSNDPIRDPPGQAFYVRDDDTGELLSPTAAPLRDDEGGYVTRHGRGYSHFEHVAHELTLELLEYVPLNDPIKISRLTIKNTGPGTRRFTVTGYVAWVLGTTRTAAAPFTMTEIDKASGAMFAFNRWSEAFADRVAFIDMSGRQTSWTGDRREFIGRNGALAKPAALSNQEKLSNRTGAGLDPCGALQLQIELAFNESIEVPFFLGEGKNADEARALIEHYRSADLDAVLSDVERHWDDLIGTVQVKTPDRTLDIMLNGWLLYQTIACRVWARSAFYQSSGAYGFRDQLQDVMALASVRPEFAKDHLLRAAGRQFREGDVQHWWLPQSGQGVRTRFADDRIWLALVAAHYVVTTGDTAILEEQAPFLEGATLNPGEMENFFQPDTSAQSASLYEHCALALDTSLKVGDHGLPLIGGGDWNDGFNRVGAGGNGESVWLGWFLYSTLTKFIPIARARGEAARADAWDAHAVALRVALNDEAWDGDWYKRGWFDDGTPLGSAASEECRIDSIAQSWSAISGAGDPQMVERAMSAVTRELIVPDTGLAMLFAPPFDRAPADPGYIKGYPPGVRENGGQYTHAALWSVIAFALLGEGDKAGGLLSMLNPINHSSSRPEAHRYKLEPYVVAADIYSQPPHIGRGGWSWYTGAAGWMYQAGVEHVLGLRIAGEFLHLDPCIPKHWPSYEMTLKRDSSCYEITVENPDGVSKGIAYAEYDGIAMPGNPLRILIKDDGSIHTIKVTLGCVAERTVG
ncbi:MAG: glycosyl transferase [Sphingomonas sp.]|nr:glycosyl transferase [Sphingomonas sp.]